MHAFAGQGIQVGRQGGHEGLAFTGLHLGNVAAVQGDAADDLHGKVLHAQHTPCGFAADGECVGQDVIGGLAFGQLLLERRGLRLQFGVGHGLIFRLQSQHLLGNGVHLFQLPVREAAKKFFNKGHWLHLIDQNSGAETAPGKMDITILLYDTPKRQMRQTRKAILARFCMNFL